MKMKRDVRRQQLLDVAMEQTLQSGWAAVDHRTIAEALEVTPTTVYSHFPNRMDLRRAVLSVATPDVERLVRAVVDNEKRMKPARRKEQLLDAAIALAREKGYLNFKMCEVTERLGVSQALYQLYFASVKQIRTEVMRAAVKREILEIIAQGLAVGDKQALKAAPDVRQRAAATLAR